MFSSLWLIADNDVWEVCQTGERTGLPSGAGPRSGCVHLTNEMSRREDGATKRSLQTNSPPPALDGTNSLSFFFWSLHGLQTDHDPLKVHFMGCLAVGSSQVCFGSEALPFCRLQQLLREFFGLLKLLMELSVNTDDPLLYLVFSSTLRRWVEVKQTLVSSFWTSKSEVEGSKIFRYFIPPSG